MRQVAQELGQVFIPGIESARSFLWHQAVKASVQDEGSGLSEHTDSFTLGMTMLFLIGQTIRSRVYSAEAKTNRERAAAGGDGGGSENGGGNQSQGVMGSPGTFRGVSLNIYDQTANEWQRVVTDDLALLLSSCLRLKARNRMLATKIVWTLRRHPSYARRLWQRMAGNDSGAWKALYADEPLADWPSLMDLARARVYACSKLMGVDDPQTRRAYASLLQLLIRTQVLGPHVLSQARRLSSESPRLATARARPCCFLQPLFAMAT